jgi:tetratricopeptide (TPR) repeat protein
MALKACIEIEIELRFLLSPSGPGRDRHSARLAASIVPRPSQNYAIKLGDEAVRLGKEFIALQPSDHSKRHISCHNLAALLYERYFQTGDRVLLEDAINFNREALALRPPSHPSRSHSCSSLAMTLLECFSYTGDTAMLKESVRLNEEALELRHVGHPDRHISYSNLASSLRVYFTVTGDEDVLDRAVELSRKVLHLRSVGHQDRYLACSDLATLLHHSYEQTWSVSLLDEAIELHKQALSLQPEGSSSQAMLCNELAVSLRSRYQRTGHGALLDEIIQLHREALALRPKPHIRRHITCSALAGSLHDRFRQTGDGDLLYEALQLDREALSLRPVGHPDRAVSCNSLASLLLSRYWQRRDTKILDEAIELQREALALQVVGLPHRDMVCSNLAASLHIRFRETNDDTLLDEAICLEREALGLRPIDHVYRPQSCYRLASYLQLLPGQPSDEISRLLDEAICLCSAEHPIRWRCLAHRAEIALRHNDHTAGISALNDLLSSPTRDIPDLLQASLRLIRDIEPTVLSHSDQQELLKSYGRTLQRVVTTAGFALDRTAQLHQVLNGTEIGPRAYALASQVDNLPAGLELLEHARGVIWSQLLQIRNPEIDRVPRSLSKELSTLLRGMTSSSSPAQTTTQLASGPLFLSKLDVHHEQRSRLERILHDIRSFPGLDDFMRGPNSQALLATAARNPVVVLVGHEKDCRALIIKSPKQPLVDIVLDIDLQTLKGLTLTAQQCGSHLNTKGQRLQFSRSKGMSPSHATLAKLWHLVVKPIILQLQLAVSDHCLLV